MPTVFYPDDVAGAVDLRAHKLILSPISSTFRDMFAFPQSPTDALGVLSLSERPT